MLGLSCGFQKIRITEFKMRASDLIHTPEIVTSRKFTELEIAIMEGGGSIEDNRTYYLRKRLEKELAEGWKEKAGAAVLGVAGLLGINGLQDNPSKVSQPTASVKQEPDANSGISTTMQLPKAAAILKKRAKLSGIHGIELAQLLAQSAHETLNFAKLEEMGNSAYFRKYDPAFNPKKAKILGNVKPGDGERYKGRGFLQITGRYNYRMAGQALGLPLEANPELAARPDIAAKIAIWYWETRVKNTVSDFKNTSAVTRKINPGMHGLDKRHAQFAYYQDQLSDKVSKSPVTQRISKTIKTDEACWKDYKQVGMKKKGGKTVPNCVPKK